ncbi:MAG: hypothetical protein ACRED4_08770, partial [Brevundimonas sp.]
VSARPGDPEFALQIGRRLKESPGAIADFAAPFSSVLTDRQSFIRIAIDGVGLGRVYRYETSRGVFISNRAVAAILLSGEVPGPCETGWASQLMFGYFWDDLSPFDRVKTFKAGEHVTLARNGVVRGSENAIKAWVDGEAEALFEGFDRMVGEVQDAVSAPHLDVNLSGGRDSRATAAMMTAHMGDRVKLRTNYPPLVERDAVVPLVQSLPYFSRMEGDLAYSSDDRVIWQARRKGFATATQGLMARARVHVRNYEGATLSTHMIGGTHDAPLFSGGRIPLGIGGGGGEISKAYGWAKSKNPAHVLRAMREVKLTDRFRDFVLTSDQSKGMLTGNRFGSYFRPLLMQYRAEAGQSGLNGYKFLNYHYLMTRVGRAAGMGVIDQQVPLFMGPHHISAALRETPHNMARAAMHRTITDHYRPEWIGMAYEGEMHSDPARRVGVGARETIFAGPHAREFQRIIHNASWFGEPYDHSAILRVFGDQTVDPGVLNQRGYDLLHRAAFMELLNQMKELCRDDREPIMQHHQLPAA